MFSTGMSFKRMMRPYMISAAIISVVTFGLGAYVIPKGNVTRLDFEDRYKKKKKQEYVRNVQLEVDSGVNSSYYNSQWQNAYSYLGSSGYYDYNYNYQNAYDPNKVLQMVGLLANIPSESATASDMYPVLRYAAPPVCLGRKYTVPSPVV